MKHSKKCPQYHLIGYIRLKNSSITETVIMVNGPEIWTRPGWMMNLWWIDSWVAVFLCFTCLLTLSTVLFRKISRKISSILFFRKTYNPTYNTHKLFSTVIFHKTVDPLINSQTLSNHLFVLIILFTMTEGGPKSQPGYYCNNLVYFLSTNFHNFWLVYTIGNLPLQDI